MLRPGGFPEYTPKEQKIFDILHKTIEQNFAQYGYQHIRTPAVESVDTLKKGGDEMSKQIFGLYGLAQGPKDAKDYALHFDLTVPFARYVLDNQNELAFPFKRYQAQPVRRGERSQKGRYKEFRQADIDVIWKSKEDKGYNAIYDADCVVTLATTIRQALDMLGLSDKHIVVRYNNKGFMQAVCSRLGIHNTTELFALLDKYYKLPKADFDAKLATLLSTQQLTSFTKVRDLEKNKKDFPEIDEHITSFTDAIKVNVKSLKNIEIIYDPSIVRGLDYYTGTVFETFIDDRKDLGSLCSGGAYANLTEFLDPKQSFSGVGGSIGLSRLMSVLIEEYDIINKFIPQDDSYLIINEEKTIARAKEIVDDLWINRWIAEIYPFPDKIEKQFKYAEKKGIQYVVQIFADGVKYKKLGGDWQKLNYEWIGKI